MGKGEESALRVLFISSHALDGGAERHLDRLLQCLPDESIAGVVTLGHGPLVHWLSARSVPVWVIATGRRLGLLASALRIRRLIARIRPAVIHADGVKAALVVGLATIGVRTPVVWLKVDYSRDGWLANLIALRCRLVIGVSRGVTETIGGRLRSRIRIVPNGIPEYRFDRAAAATRVRQLIGCGRDDEVVIHMARMFRPKGHLELIEVVPGILMRRPATRFLFVSPKVRDRHEREYAKLLRRRVDELGIAHAVALVSGADEPVELLSGADVAVIPSVPDEISGWREGFGLVAAEAMAVGTPIVAYAEGGLPETIGECGRIVPVGARPELLSAIVEVLDDERLAARLAACGRERAKRYTVHANAESMRRCYREAARGL
jgi:glycosyltransferase involved in cell wall biosynthesis